MALGLGLSALQRPAPILLLTRGALLLAVRARHGQLVRQRAPPLLGLDQPALELLDAPVGDESQLGRALLRRGEPIAELAGHPLARADGLLRLAQLGREVRGARLRLRRKARSLPCSCWAAARAAATACSAARVAASRASAASSAARRSNTAVLAMFSICVSRCASSAASSSRRRSAWAAPRSPLELGGVSALRDLLARQPSAPP